MYAAQQTSGYAGQAPMATVAELEIPGQVNQLEQALASLIASADELCVRLTPIRRQTGNAIGSDKVSAPEPVLCPMANLLREARRRVEGVTTQLNVVRSELEV